MTLNSFSRAAAAALALTALAGCGSLSNTLGLERHVPDESQVVVRPPLTLPPDYNLMPPGTASPVSGDHEGAQPAGESGMAAVPPKKEERGFFGRLFSGDIFGDDSDSGTPKPSAPDAAAPPADGAAPEPASAPPKG